MVYKELERSTSGTDRAVSISVLASRSKDSSRTELSRSVILTALLETVAVERAGPLMEKIELEVVVKVGWLEAILVCAREEGLVDRQEWAEETVATGNSISSSDGILQMGWWAARINSSLSFSFKRLAMSFCRLDFSSSSKSVSAWSVSVSSRLLLRHFAAACLFLSLRILRFSSSSGGICSSLPLLEL